MQAGTETRYPRQNKMPFSLKKKLKISPFYFSMMEKYLHFKSGSEKLASNHIQPLLVLATYINNTRTQQKLCTL